MSTLSELLKMARVKYAFVPAGDPSMGGAPPMDPSMGGGAPPPMDPSMGGAPPIDPSMGGGAPPPPMDPSMGGAPPGPPPAPAGDPMAGIGDAISKAVRTELSAAGLVPQGGNGAGPGGKAPKPDINTIATDVFQLKKMFMHVMKMQGIELPMDILDGPNRDPMTGAPSVSESGGSEASSSGAPSDDGGGASPAIQPIQPIQPAMGPPGGGGGKSASIGRPIDVARTSAAALAESLARRAKG